MEKIRLQKWLADLGLCSRREAERWMLQDRLKINGKLARPGDHVCHEHDKVELDGEVLGTKQPPKVYWLFHKPDKFLTSHRREDDKERIYDLPNLSQLSFRIFPVGRLDYRTEGLLLLTNDGELSYRLCHPKFKQPRKYQVLINGKLTKAQLSALRKGITLDDGPVRCEIGHAQGVNLGKTKGCWYLITVWEGRNRLVRRIFESMDLKVVRLIRYGFGDLRLTDQVQPGSYRQLSQKEIQYLKKSVRL